MVITLEEFLTELGWSREKQALFINWQLYLLYLTIKVEEHYILLLWVTIFYIRQIV